MKKLLLGCFAAAALLMPTQLVQAAAGDTVKTIKERGSLLCTGHNGSYLGFALMQKTPPSRSADDFAPNSARVRM